MFGQSESQNDCAVAQKQGSKNWRSGYLSSSRNVFLILLLGAFKNSKSVNLPES